MSPPSRRNRPDARCRGFVFARRSCFAPTGGRGHGLRLPAYTAWRVGRLVVTGILTVDTSSVTEVAGDVDDPMIQRRREVLEPLCLACARAWARNTSTASEARNSRAPSCGRGSPLRNVWSARCRLVFAEGAVDVARASCAQRATRPEATLRLAQPVILPPRAARADRC